MLTCGMISPKTTMPRVAPMTATRPPPPVSASSRIVNVLFTFEWLVSSVVVVLVVGKSKMVVT